MLKELTLLGNGFLLIGFLSAKDFWIERPYTEWSQKEAVKILIKSPWSSTQTVRSGASPFVTGPSPAELQSTCSTCPEDAATVPATLSDPQQIGTDDPRGNVLQHEYFVRFRTATPVRMALARLAVLGGKTSVEQAQEYVESVEFPDQIVIVVEPASGREVPELNEATFGLLEKSTYLHLKKSQRRIPLQQYVTPSQFGGTQAFFIFPRVQNEEELISSDEEEVRFVCQLNSRTKIEGKFKLKKMLYRGVLDL